MLEILPAEFIQPYLRSSRSIDRSIDSIVRFAGEIKAGIFCLPLFIFIIYCKALRFLAIVWETFLKSRNAVVIWQSADEAYRVHHSTVVDKCIETQCLAFLNILEFL